MAKPVKIERWSRESLGIPKEGKIVGSIDVLDKKGLVVRRIWLREFKDIKDNLVNIWMPRRKIKK